jgi:hypothetical protein
VVRTSWFSSDAGDRLPTEEDIVKKTCKLMNFAGQHIVTARKIEGVSNPDVLPHSIKIYHHLSMADMKFMSNEQQRLQDAAKANDWLDNMLQVRECFDDSHGDMGIYVELVKDRK